MASVQRKGDVSFSFWSDSCDPVNTQGACEICESSFTCAFSFCLPSLFYILLSAYINITLNLLQMSFVCEISVQDLKETAAGSFATPDLRLKCQESKIAKLTSQRVLLNMVYHMTLGKG